MTHSLPKLAFDYSDLDPYIDATTMNIHYNKHHAGYVAKLNASIENTDYQHTPIDELISTITTLPEDIQASVRNNGGGHANHTLFWSILSPTSSKQPEGALLSAIEKEFGSFEQFKTAFAAAAASRFGSGWAWLGVKSNGDLCVCSTPNQDNPLMTGVVDCTCIPILGLDVWEHAYYLAYQNKRPDYINAFWNIINWDVVSEYYSKAI